MELIHISDIEAALDWWRARRPSPDGIRASAEVSVLAEPYGRMIHDGLDGLAFEAFSPEAQQAWLTWYASTPDAPCIAICSTTQGDAVCKGCGRTFDEVQHWIALSPAHKRAVWRRITLDGSAWRFNRYAERAQQMAARTAVAVDQA